MTRLRGSIGGDRLLCDDVTEAGFHRIVVAQKGRWPNVEAFFQTALERANGNALVDGWLVEIDGFYYLWLTWKDGE